MNEIDNGQSEPSELATSQIEHQQQPQEAQEQAAEQQEHDLEHEETHLERAHDNQLEVVANKGETPLICIYSIIFYYQIHIRE